MPLPTVTFSTLDQWENWIDNNIITNGIQAIDGNDGNITENAAVKFIKKATFNYELSGVNSSGGDIVLDKNITVIISITPDSLTWNDNFSNEWTIVNMTGAIQLLSGTVYYDPSGNALGQIPANSVLHIAKAINGLWVQTDGGTGSTGAVQKQPKTYIVGTTSGAPVAGAMTWTLPAFENSYVILFINRISADLEDSGDGSPYTIKLLASDTLTVGNYSTGWNNGDILTYILITP